MTHHDDPFAELKTTGALLLLVASLIGGVLGAVEWGSGNAVAAASICAAAALGFAVSVAWFISEGQPVGDALETREAHVELPFPSWLRNEADAA